MRAIYADAALKALRKCQTYLYDARDPELKIELSSAEAAINNLPTIQPVATDTNVGDTISRQWLMECVNEGWIKFDTEKDENRFIHLVRDIAPSVQPETHEERTETHACDLISRQAAIDALDCISGVEEVLRSLPSAQPERVEGEWIPVHPIQSDDPGAYMCSECENGMWEIRPSSYHYCPNCGAKMKGAKHETD